MSITPSVGGRLRPSERRLLLGYGPAVVIAAAFLLMTLLVPTVAPEQNVSAAGPGGGAATQGLGATSGLPASGTGSTGNGAASPGGAAAAGAPGARPAAAGGGPAGRPSAGAPGVVSGCSGRQVPTDPYSPACVSFSGNNGGATSRGVTSNSIAVTYRIPADNITSVESAIQQVAGKYNASRFNDTAESVKRTLDDLITYFNQHFQMYGRKMVLHELKGQGQLTQEITDAGQAQAQADALTASSVGAFADISALSQPYAEALSAQKIMNFGVPYMSQPWFEAHAPYSWSFFPNCTDLGDESAAVLVKQIAPQKVTFAGTGVANGQPRKIATIAPDNPVYQQCASRVTSAMAAAGYPVTANISYTLDLSQLSQEAASMAQQIVNDGVTTVGCACDPITLVYLTADLENAHYLPEFLNVGAAFTDIDLVGQLFDQGSWAHAAGITNNGAVPPYGGSIGYFAAKSVDPGNPPAHIVDIIYEDLYLLALGIQLAGPDLTPSNFQGGMFNYGGGNGEFGPWTFNVGGQGFWTPQHQFRYEWWNPNAISSFDQEKGAWTVGSSYLGARDVPNAPAPVFPNGPQ